MPEKREYIATEHEALFAKRAVLRYSHKRGGGEVLLPKRIRVPFSGFDGQALAGTGALVWEGEVLESVH